ncbi:MAG TPA: substrate-binding domain-containing protein, partial [Anaerolineaceae bacterium]
VSKLNPDENPIKQLRSMLGRRVDGIIWCIPETDHSHDWINEIQSDPGIPIVLAFCTEKPHYSSVWVDNYSGGYQATHHLIQHGCQKIAHITGPISHRESKDRKAGWETALKEAGLEASRVVEGGWDIQDGWHSMERLIEEWPDFDAVFVAADQPALGAINFLKRRGKRVPEDIKVIGFDDVYELDYFDPPLTSIHQDYEKFGANLVEELSRRIQDPSTAPVAQVLPTYLVARRSCGCDHDSPRNDFKQNS